MKNVKDILIENNFHFKKQLGQNFLSDKNLLKAIVVDAGVDKTDEVLEIGPGRGALTQFLATTAQKVVCYEIDNTLEAVLLENLKHFNNVNILFKDVLKTPINEIELNFLDKYKVVANIPYYITTPLIFKFLENTIRVTTITLMIQKEVAEKLIAKPSQKNYGALSVMCSYYADIRLVRRVSRRMFYPVPKVDSAVVKLIIKNPTYDKDFTQNFIKLVHASFSMRRKTLINNISSAFNLSKQEVEGFLKRLKKDKNIRAEEFTKDDFINLTKLIFIKDK